MAASFPSAIKNFSAVINGVTKLVAALFNSPYDEITAIETALGADMCNIRLGAWVDKSSSYGAQQAATDGFVIGLTAASQGLIIYSDANNPPVTIRGQCIGDASNKTTAMCPVKKSDYWKVTVTGGSPNVYWIPLGG